MNRALPPRRQYYDFCPVEIQLLKVTKDGLQSRFHRWRHALSLVNACGWPIHAKHQWGFSLLFWFLSYDPTAPRHVQVLTATTRRRR